MRYYIDFYDMMDGWSGHFGLDPTMLFSDLELAKKKCLELQAVLPVENKKCGEHYGVIDGETMLEVFCSKADNRPGAGLVTKLKSLLAQLRA